MRLIDADKIVYSWQIDEDGEEHDGITLQSIIKKMPTIDAVEIIKCSDCKYMTKYYAERETMDDYLMEPNLQTLVDGYEKLTSHMEKLKQAYHSLSNELKIYGRDLQDYYEYIKKEEGNG